MPVHHSALCNQQPRIKALITPLEIAPPGFWYEYKNIFSLLRELNIPWPLTDWTTSGFWVSL